MIGPGNLGGRGRVALAVTALLAGVGCLAAVAWGWFWPDPTSYAWAGTLGAVCATAFGGATALLGPPPVPRVGRARWWPVLVAAGVGAVLIWHFGHRHLGGFDHSALIDVGWRVARRQRPVRDFPGTLPVGFVFASGWALRRLGASWSSLVGLQAIFAAGTLIWSYALLLRITRSPGRSLLLAAAIQACTNVVTSYWWYNPATSTLGAVYFISAVALWREPRTRAVSFSYLAALVLLAAMKPNVAGVLILGSTAVLLLSRELRARVAVLSVLGLALFAGLLALGRVRLPDVVRGYLSISARGFSLAQFLQDLTFAEKVGAWAMLGALLLPWLGRVRRLPGDGRGRRLAVAALVAGLYGFVTNGESKLVDVPLMLLALWWACECDSPMAPQAEPASCRAEGGWGGYVRGLAATAILVGILVGALRHRVEMIGPGTFFEPRVSPRKLVSPFFSRLEGSPILVELEAEVAALLASSMPARPWFGPRMQWAYAAFGRRSPSGQPPWWHAGVTYPPVRAVEDALIRRWVAEDHDLLVLLKGDTTYLPAELLAEIEARYEERPGFKTLTVYAPRGPR